MTANDPLQTVQFSIASGAIELGIGQPGFDLLPLEILNDAAQHRLTQPDPTILQYGAAQGNGRFRVVLADFLTEGYGTAVTPESIFTTTGASRGLDLICTLFSQPGDVIFVEEPTYFLALRVLADHHLRIVGIPVDENGIRLDSLREALGKHTPKFLYTIPTFQNPTAVTQPENHRQEIIQLSQQYGFKIVADEVYQLLYYQQPPPAPYAAYLDAGNILSINSFSKILAPGLRLGWLQTSPDLMTRFTSAGITQSGGGLNPFTSAIGQSVIEKGWQAEHLEKLKGVYKRRADVLATAVGTHFDGIATYNQPNGGLFIWLTFPEQINTNDLLPIAQAYKVGFQPGIRFSSQGELANSLRLSFAFFDEDDLVEGVKRLRQAYDHMTQTDQPA